MSNHRFAEFDFMSKEGNQMNYHQDIPPIIDLTQISDSVPMAFFVGLDDDLSTPDNAQWARD